jgi:hypothetical protein
MGFSVYYIQLYVIKIDSDLWPVNGFLSVLYTTVYDKDGQWLVTGQWVSQCTIYNYVIKIDSDLWPVNGFLSVLYTTVYNKDGQRLATGQWVSLGTIYNCI